MKHICIISPGHPPETHSWGIGTYTGILEEVFRERAFKTTIISRSDSIMQMCFENKRNIDIIRIPGPEYSKDLNLRDWLPVLRKVWLRINEKNKINITECADWGGEYLAIQDLNTPSILRLHSPGFLVEPYNKENPFFLSEDTKKMEKEAIESARFLSAPNNVLFEELSTQVTIKGNKYHIPYIPPKIVFDANDDIKKLGNIINVVVVGRIEPRKGQEILLKALKKLGKNVRYEITFVGADTICKDGQSYKDYILKEMPYWLIKRIDFVGFVARCDVSNYIKKSDFLVMPSQFENFGFVALEAMSLGKPIILPNLSTLNDMVVLENDLVFKSGDFDDLSQLLSKIYRDKNRYYEYCINTKRFYKKKIDRETAINKMLKNYEEVIKLW